VKALINITSDGLVNLTRVAAPVGYEIDRLIEPHPIFPLIQRHAGVEDSEMFEVFNMGHRLLLRGRPRRRRTHAFNRRAARPRGAGDRHRGFRPAEDRAHRNVRACRPG
jgi:hypothetical protein